MRSEIRKLLKLCAATESETVCVPCVQHCISCSKGWAPRAFGISRDGFAAFVASDSGSVRKMPRPYSCDLRWRIVWSYFMEGMTNLTGLSERFLVHRSTAQRYVDRFLETGDVRPMAYVPGPPPALGPAEEEIVLNAVAFEPGTYLDEIRDYLYLQSGGLVDVDESTVCRTLRKWGMSRQVIRRVALQRNELRRQHFRDEYQAIPMSEMFVFVDETGNDKRSSYRRQGYSLRNLPPVDHTLLVRGDRYSSIAAMSQEGVLDCYICRGSVNGDTFLEFVEQCLVPVLLPFDGINPRSIVVLDNASVHRVQAVQEAILNTGALLVYLPPYSPDLNPIECVFHSVKCFVRAHYPQEFADSPVHIITEAFASVSPAVCSAYIKYAGYL